MKVVFLNVWGDVMQDTLVGYLEEQARDTDIFCFQEATEAMRRRCADALSNYTETTHHKYVTAADDFWVSTFIRKDITVLSSEVLMPDDMDTGIAICSKVQASSDELYVCNIHGMSRPKEKRDDPGRIKQSQELINFFKDKSEPVIIGGDFNLFPDTQSITMFAEHGYRDLIKEFDIATTRNHFAWDRFPVKMNYSDYVFLKGGVVLKSFTVTDNEVSDHLPLLLEIEV